MANIIDLDELLGADKKVRLHGKVYTLPPDLPVELYLKITKLAQQNASEQEMVETLSGGLLELFRYKDPKLTFEQLGLSMSHLVTAVAKIYGGDVEDEAPRPPRRTRGGASSKTPRTTR